MNENVREQVPEQAPVRLEVRLKGGLFLGGGAGPGLHGATVRDAHGCPFIPASALKGAIREQLCRLKGAAAADHILGGPGSDPLLPPDAEQNQQAAIERQGGGSTRVRFTDAVLVDPNARAFFERQLGHSDRTRVAIDRRRGRAADKHLFVHQILTPAPGQDAGRLLVAKVTTALLDAAQYDTLKAAVAAVFALGGSRTAGLGGVELRLVSGACIGAEQAASNVPSTIPEGDELDLFFEALEPLAPGSRWSGNFLQSYGHIPAATLRGALVTAALGVRARNGQPELATQDQSSEPWFQEAVLNPDTCWRLSDAWPVDEPVAETADTSADLPRVPPLTLKTCKRHGYKHGTVDTLLSDYLFALLCRERSWVKLAEGCPQCQGRLVAAEKPLHSVPVIRRLVTRLKLDAPTGRSHDGHLFTLELLERDIERGTWFRARVSGLNPESRRLLADAAAGELRVGHGRGQGYGRLRLAAVRAAPGGDLARQVEDFDQCVRAQLQALAAAFALDATKLGADRHFLAVTLLSDLVLPKGERAEAAWHQALELAGSEVVFAQVRTGQRGGWDARARRPRPIRPTIRAGSVLLLATDRKLSELLPRLQHLEQRGLGDLREEGCGQLRISDPIHLESHGRT